jgi:PAS domain S-box-containing protein
MLSPSAILSAKVLIVDDQEANVRLLERMLAGAGYTSVVSTIDPFQVCELHRKNSYDLILLDLQMPGMDGFQVMEGLKAIEIDGYLPVLVITAQPEHKLRALKAGARDFVSAPFDVAEVLMRVHHMLEVRLLHLETKRLYAQLVAEHKEDEEYFRLLALHLREVLWVADGIQTKMRYVSPAYETVWGRTRQTLFDSPQSFLDAVDPKDKERVVDAVAKRQQTGRYEEEYRIRRPDGSVRWIWDRGYPVPDEQGLNKPVAQEHQGPVHLLISDVVMPVMGGRPLAERIAALRPGIKVLYVSGYAPDAVVRNGAVESQAAFLQKPFTPSTLIRKAREALDQ